jgi:hypothetical protein
LFSLALPRKNKDRQERETGERSVGRKEPPRSNPRRARARKPQAATGDHVISRRHLFDRNAPDNAIRSPCNSGNIHYLLPGGPEFLTASPSSRDSCHVPPPPRLAGYGLTGAGGVGTCPNYFRPSTTFLHIFSLQLESNGHRRVPMSMARLRQDIQEGSRP